MDGVSRANDIFNFQALTSAPGFLPSGTDARTDDCRELMRVARGTTSLLNSRSACREQKACRLSKKNYSKRNRAVLIYKNLSPTGTERVTNVCVVSHSARARAHTYTHVINFTVAPRCSVALSRISALPADAIRSGVQSMRCHCKFRGWQSRSQIADRAARPSLPLVRLDTGTS